MKKFIVLPILAILIFATSLKKDTDAAEFDDCITWDITQWDHHIEGPGSISCWCVKTSGEYNFGFLIECYFYENGSFCMADQCTLNDCCETRTYN
jgi:hypothetical protein